MIKPRRLRAMHRALAPLMVAPLLLTLITGIAFQSAVVSGNANAYLWLLDLHRGRFGSVNLDMVYPFLNGLGLLVLLVSGILMWLQVGRRSTS